MKSKFIFLLIFLLAAFSCLQSCKKTEKEAPLPETIFGDWHFTVRILSTYMDPSIPTVDERHSYSGNIKEGDNANEIVINYLTGYSVTLSIDEEGNLGNFPSHYSSGAFEGKTKLNLLLRWGGLGGGISHSIEGTKK